MKTIVVGDRASIEDFKLKFSELLQNVSSRMGLSGNKKVNNGNLFNFPIEGLIFVEKYEELDMEILKEKAIVFDFFLDESIENFEIYKSHSNLVIFGNIPKSSLSEIRFFYGSYEPVLFGFNGLPGMLNRHYLEVTSYSDKDHPLLKEVCDALQTDFLMVDDRVGMVTPRIISMIINEAYFTVQEKTANKEDIDSAMKLGTNYPWGPFEWSHKLGLNNVYELLEAIYNDTKDERYKICPLLKREYMRTLKPKSKNAGSRSM